MKKLGRGLGAILEDVEAGYLKSIPENGVKEIPVEKIKINPFQPRKNFNEEAINELAASIKKHGLMQPVIVIEDNGEFILVAGERRLRAVKSLGQKEIKAIVSDISLNELREYALIENIQREDLNPVEIAASLKSLIDEHGYTHETLAKNIGKSRSYITNILRLLNLPEFVKEKVAQNQISYGHAKILSGLSENEILKTVENIQKHDLSVRETEKFVKNLKKPVQKKEKEENFLDENVLEIAKKLKNMGLKIELGKDYLKISYKNKQDFENLRKLLDNLN